jgi:hypothetical protein
VIYFSKATLKVVLGKEVKRIKRRASRSGAAALRLND